MKIAPLTLSRVIAFAASLTAAIAAFTSVQTPGKITAGSIAAGLLAVWLHEEHATERNATSAAASITPASGPTAAQAQELLGTMHGALGALGGAPIAADGMPAPTPPGASQR